MMTKDEARRVIVADWLKLPAAAREAEPQAAVFAMKALERYRWRASGDPYQEAMAWISAHIGKD